jgi:hypothetical protein
MTHHELCTQRPLRTLTAQRLQARFYKSHHGGLPIYSHQHPLHYPHGTLFMAPGPAGQTFPIPNDPYLRDCMVREFRNYQVIHQSYNFNINPSDQSIMGQALLWWNEKMRPAREERRIKEGEAEECAPRSGCRVPV